MPRAIIWTPAIRQALFDAVTAQFGSYRTWQDENKPGNGKNKAFDTFCANFAATFRMKSGPGVHHAILYGKPVLPNGADWSSSVERAMRSQLAALDAGFITRADLPTIVKVGRPL